MKRVLKWTVLVDGNWHQMGFGKVLHVASQYGRNYEVQVWTEEECDDQGNPPTPVGEAIVVGTGRQAPDRAEPIGSVVVSGGHLVWHVYRSIF